ncbi:hypothetical protein BS17DRAFT_765235 [Gyrodon lividus]|nr:hypothetical protein BS17DRAFT_765235 [Gyrodon lividus]
MTASTVLQKLLKLPTNFTIPTTSLPHVTVLLVDLIVPSTNTATTSKATGDPKDVTEDCKQANKGMLVESNRTSKMTTQAGEGKGKGTTTKRKTKKYIWCPGTKKMEEFKNYYDKVLSLKQRKEYHDEARTLISAGQWNSDMDVCNGPIH